MPREKKKRRRVKLFKESEHLLGASELENTPNVSQVHKQEPILELEKAVGQEDGIPRIPLRSS